MVSLLLLLLLEPVAALDVLASVELSSAINENQVLVVF